MANSANQLDQTQARFSYYTYDFNVTQNLLREEDYSDNAFIATIQKVIKLVGVVVAGGVEAFKNGAKLFANGFIYLANVVNDFFNPAPLKNRQVEVLQPAAPAPSSSSSSSSLKPTSLEPLVIDDKDIPLITETVPFAPPSPTDLDGIPFADLVPASVASTAEPTVVQEEAPAQSVAAEQTIVEQPPVVQQLPVEQPAAPSVQQEEAPVLPIVAQPPVVEAAPQPIQETVEPVAQADSSVENKPAAVVGNSEPSAPASPKQAASAEPSVLPSMSDIEESDDRSVEEEQEVLDTQAADELDETKSNESSLEIELPQEIADRILNVPQAPTYRAYDPRRAWQWFRKSA